MNRGSFLRSLFIVAASPKILAEINIKPKIAPSALFNDLKVIIPDFIPSMIAKYGNEDFTWWLTEYGKHPIESRITITKDNYL